MDYHYLVTKLIILKKLLKCFDHELLILDKLMKESGVKQPMPPYSY